MDHRNEKAFLEVDTDRQKRLGLGEARSLRHVLPREVGAGPSEGFRPRSQPLPI